MKKIIISWILIVFAFNCNGQVSDSIKSNHAKSTYVTSFDQRLPEYQVDACLYKLLLSVVRSNTQYYKPDKFFYSLIIKKREKYQDLFIMPELWKKAKRLDYVGVVRVTNMSFLCHGDFANDLLFHRKKGKIKIGLTLTKDSSDSASFIQDPSLQGEFPLCKGHFMYIEIYTEGRISGYSSKVIANKTIIDPK